MYVGPLIIVQIMFQRQLYWYYYFSFFLLKQKKKFKLELLKL